MSETKMPAVRGALQRSLPPLPPALAELVHLTAGDTVLARLTLEHVRATMPDSPLVDLMEGAEEGRVDLQALSPVHIAVEDHGAIAALLEAPAAAERMTSPGVARFADAWLLPCSAPLTLLLPGGLPPITLSTQQVHALQRALAPYRAVYPRWAAAAVSATLLQVPATARNATNPRVRAALQVLLQDAGAMTFFLADAHALATRMQPERLAALLAPHHPPPQFAATSRLMQWGERRAIAAALQRHVQGGALLTGSPAWPAALSAPSAVEVGHAYKIVRTHLLQDGAAVRAAAQARARSSR